MYHSETPNQPGCLSGFFLVLSTVGKYISPLPSGTITIFECSKINGRNLFSPSEQVGLVLTDFAKITIAYLAISNLTNPDMANHSSVIILAAGEAMVGLGQFAIAASKLWGNTS